MKAIQKGFTLIELIVVIVILGILAATALPKFIDLKDDAGQAAVDGVAGGLASAAAINYAGKKAGKTVTPATMTAADVCDSGTGANKLGDLLVAGWPSGFTVADAGTTTCALNGAQACTVTQTSTGKTAVANITCY